MVLANNNINLLFDVSSLINSHIHIDPEGCGFKLSNMQVIIVIHFKKMFQASSCVL